MAKLMAPNIRIDWYPEDHFDDVENPTVSELNSGYNLSCAVVTGFTLDFSESNTEDSTTILDDFESQIIVNHTYEANLQFFLAERGMSEEESENVKAYKTAERLFHNMKNPKGFLGKRFGYRADVPYGGAVGQLQNVTLFAVQADLPKITTEDDAPIMLEVGFHPQGLATIYDKVANFTTYEWEDEPNNSISFMISDGEVMATNYHKDPQGKENKPANFGVGGDGKVSHERITDVSDGPVNGITSYWRATVEEVSETGSGGWSGTSNSFHTDLPIPKGKYATISYYVRYIGSEPYTEYTPRFHYYDSDGSSDFSNKSKTKFHNNKWQRVVHSVKAPFDAKEISFWLYYIGGDITPKDATVDITGFMVTKGTEDLPFFDGSFSEHYAGEIVYEWEDGEHSSVSLKIVEGKTVAKNLVNDPQPQSVDSFYYQRSEVEILPNGGIRMTSDGVSGQVRIDAKNRPKVVAGEYVALAVDMRSHDGEDVYAGLLGYDGSSYESSVGSTDVYSGDKWSRKVVVAEVPENVDNVEVRARFLNQSLDSGFVADFKNFHLVSADTEEEALDQIKQYFDGDTPDENIT